MRFVTWNCRIGGFRDKAVRIAPLRADVLVVPETSHKDSQSAIAGDPQPTFRNSVAHPVYWRRSIGVFSYTDLQLTAVDLSEPMYEFRRFEARRGDLEFHVVGVWTAPAETIADDYKQAIRGLHEHRDWISAKPTIVLGDFNDNASYQPSNWLALTDAVTQLDLVSAYHVSTGEKFGEESRATHFHKGSLESPWHVDYCFVPNEWAHRIQNVEVGTHQGWSDLSDHVPLIVDLDL